MKTTNKEDIDSNRQNINIIENKKQSQHTQAQAEAKY